MPYHVIAQYDDGRQTPICRCESVRSRAPDPLMEFADAEDAQAEADRLNEGLHVMAPMTYAVAEDI